MKPTTSQMDKLKLLQNSTHELIFQALTRAFRDLFQPALLLTLLAIPAAGILVFLIGLYFFWSPLREFLLSLLNDTFFANAFQWSMGWLISDPSSVFAFFVGILTLLLTLPLGFVFVTIVFSIVTPLVILNRVHLRSYPELKKHQGTSLLKSIWNSLFSSALYIFLWTLSLPLIVFPPAFLFTSHLLTSQLHARVFSYDVLAEFLPDEKLALARNKYRGSFFQLALVACLIFYIPFLNLIGIVYIALAFTHFGMLLIQRDHQK